MQRLQLQSITSTRNEQTKCSLKIFGRQIGSSFSVNYFRGETYKESYSYLLEFNKIGQNKNLKFLFPLGALCVNQKNFAFVHRVFFSSETLDESTLELSFIFGIIHIKSIRKYFVERKGYYVSPFQIPFLQSSRRQKKKIEFSQICYSPKKSNRK